MKVGMFINTQFPEGDHVADYDGSRCGGAGGDGACRQLIECAAPHLLPARRRVDDDGGRRIHGGEAFHGEHRLKEAAALAAELLGNFDAHQTEFEHLAQQIFAEERRGIHFANEGSNALAGKAADRVLKHALFCGEQGQRRGKGGSFS